MSVAYSSNKNTALGEFHSLTTEQIVCFAEYRGRGYGFVRDPTTASLSLGGAAYSTFLYFKQRNERVNFNSNFKVFQFRFLKNAVFVFVTR